MNELQMKRVKNEIEVIIYHIFSPISLHATKYLKQKQE